MKSKIFIRQEEITKKVAPLKGPRTIKKITKPHS